MQQTPRNTASSYTLRATKDATTVTLYQPSVLSKLLLTISQMTWKNLPAAAKATTSKQRNHCA
jgi:hypothetical protein